MRDERIPWSKLRHFQAQAYGLREGARRSDGRYGLEDFNDVPS